MLEQISKEGSWKGVTGPTTGVARTLVELGWDLQSPTVWKYKDQSYQRGGQQSKEGLLEAIGGAIESKLWQDASAHRLGSGLEWGEPMLAPVTKLINDYKKKGQAGMATVLMKVAAGGIITPAVLNEMNPDHDEVCRCGHFLPTEEHLFWSCRLLQEDKREEVTNSNLDDEPGRKGVGHQS